MTTYLLLISSLLLFLASICIVIINNRKLKKTYEKIEKMLLDAIDGKFVQTSFTEDRLSHLESLLAEYLSSSNISRKKIEEEKDKIKALISDISHQTKTPISSSLLYCELLSEQELTEEEKKSVDAIHIQLEKLTFLINSLMKLSRLENGIIELKPELSEINSLLQYISNTYSQKAKDKGLELAIEETTVKAYFDTKWTNEALGNIVDNAIKYTEKGYVSISVKEYEMFVRIDIKDTGIGIDESESSKIFTRFYRSEKVREKEGVGIGLYLAREIIFAESGYIKLNSKTQEGSTFSIFLSREKRL